MQGVYDQFPTIIVLTLVVVFVLIGSAFRSVIAPLRSVATICITLSAVYGMAVLVYQHGLLSWLNMRCLSEQGNIAWLPPVMCFSIVLGLGLDYDVFLCSRVYEYRNKGLTDKAAALKVRALLLLLLLLLLFVLYVLHLFTLYVLCHYCYGLGIVKHTQFSCDMHTCHYVQYTALYTHF